MKKRVVKKRPILGKIKAARFSPDEEKKLAKVLKKLKCTYSEWVRQCLADELI